MRSSAGTPHLVRCRSNGGPRRARCATERTFLAAALLAAAAAAQEIRSPNGRFLARLRLPSEVEVAAASAPAESPLWTARNLALAPAELWLLADDGRALAGVAERAESGKPVVQVVRQGALLLSADAAALALPPDLRPDWLAKEPRGVLLREIERDGKPQFALDLLGRDG